jgi:hypothetical protein
MSKPDHRSQMARAWLHIHAALGRTWKQGVQVLRVDWPVYPRRAEHNTVAEGGNRRWAETCPSERAYQSRWPRPTRGPRAKASAEIDVAAVTVEASPQTEPERPRAPHQAACEPPSALSGGDEGVEGPGPPAGLPPRSGASSWRRPLWWQNKGSSLGRQGTHRRQGRAGASEPYLRNALGGRCSYRPAALASSPSP